MGSLARSSALVHVAAAQPKSPASQRRAVLADNTNRQLNHSPVESPPTVKKKLCRLAKQGLTDGHQGALDSLDAAFVFEAPAVELAQIALGTIPRSLQGRPRLERSNSATSRSSCSILKQQKNLRSSMRAKSATSWPPHKGVKFQDDVTVFRIDDEGSYVCTECQKLRGEPRTPQELLHANTAPCGYSSLQRRLTAPAHTSRTPSLPRQQQQQQQASTALVPAAGASISSVALRERDTLPATLQSLEGNTAVNFTFVEDQMHGLKLKFVVPLGLGYGPNDIVVKANMSGSRIRVVANKTVTKAGCQEQFNERYALPMDVDPYMVTARLDVRGQLIVEAPLMTLARRQSLVTGRQTNSRAAEQAYAAH